MVLMVSTPGDAVMAPIQLCSFKIQKMLRSVSPNLDEPISKERFVNLVSNALLDAQHIEADRPMSFYTMNNVLRGAMRANPGQSASAPQAVCEAAAHIFDNNLDLSGTGSVSVREAISHFRFGFVAAAGSLRASPSRLTSSTAREVRRAYDHAQSISPPRSPQQRRPHGLLQPLAASRDVDHFPLPPVEVNSRSASPTFGLSPPTFCSSLPGWNEMGDMPPQRGVRAAAMEHLQKPTPRSSSMPCLVSPSTPCQSSRPAAAVMRQLSARLGKVRRPVDALLEGLDDGTGRANMETLTTELFELGTGAKPPVSISREELRAALQLYEAPGTGTVLLRQFARDLWSGTVRRSILSPVHKPKQSPASAVEDSMDEDVQPQNGASDEHNRQRMQRTVQLTLKFGRKALEKSASARQDRAMAARQGLQRKVTSAIKWWNVVGKDESQRAAGHLLESLRDKAGDDGQVTREQFHGVLYSLGVLRSFEDETNVLFGVPLLVLPSDSLDKDGDGILQLSEIESAVEELIHAPAESRLQSLLHRDDAEIGSSIQRLRDKLAAQSARVLDLFRKWDIDGDGRVTKDEFARALPDLGMSNCTTADIDALFDAFDEDGEGEISFRELHRMLRRAEPTKEKAKRVVETVSPFDTDELRKQVRIDLLKTGIGYEMRKTYKTKPSTELLKSASSVSGAQRNSNILSGFELEHEEDAAMSVDQDVKTLSKARHSAVLRSIAGDGL